MTGDASGLRVTPEPTADEAAAIAAAIASIRNQTEESSDEDAERIDRWQIANRIHRQTGDRDALAWVSDGNTWVIGSRLGR